MVSGCFAASGMGNLVFIENNMGQYKYINILKENLKISAQALGIQNTVKLSQRYSPKCSIMAAVPLSKVIKTPPYSPDLNLIENVWHELEKRTRKHDISSKEQLKAVLTEEWNKF
ncbi:hypothetical protein AVEN_275464-1 [Araneus ventricosus]|uniref:Tc1-like transposase DDE domain-containing protein n=1 Tax=Araneus ventricosus TaxID=182803 RepID=A0A4Y2E8Q0_ARAVE|nr:hypothetical protein AVEN_275464-1 [Araneus ventricosus]